MAGDIGSLRMTGAEPSAVSGLRGYGRRRTAAGKWFLVLGTCNAVALAANPAISAMVRRTRRGWRSGGLFDAASTPQTRTRTSDDPNDLRAVYSHCHGIKTNHAARISWPSPGKPPLAAQLPMSAEQQASRYRLRHT